MYSVAHIIQRNVLKEFYYSTKGNEWTEATNWIDPYSNYCDWMGVQCLNSTIIGLNLTHNGLSGKLYEVIASLHELKVLDLSDNDIKVCLKVSFILILQT